MREAPRCITGLILLLAGGCADPGRAYLHPPGFSSTAHLIERQAARDRAEARTEQLYPPQPSQASSPSTAPTNAASSPMQVRANAAMTVRPSASP